MIPEGHKDPDSIIVGTILFDNLIEEKNIETNSNKFLNAGWSCAVVIIKISLIPASINTEIG